MKDTKSPNTTTLIHKTSRLDANIDSLGAIHISGTINGDVVAKQQIVITETGRVHGNIATNQAEISGHVEGNVKVSGVLVIQNTAKVNGDVQAKSMATVQGAQINGKVQIGKDVLLPGEAPAIDQSLKKKAG